MWRPVVSLILLIGLVRAADARAQELDTAGIEAREPGRHALVIGNPTYDKLAPLSGASLDADSVAQRLRDLRFDVTLEPGLPSRREMEERILPTFRSRVKPGDIVVFYYSGHGFAFGTSNYLAPRDLTLKIEDYTKVDRLAVAVESVEAYLAGAEPSLIVILVDACRTIPGFEITQRPGSPENLVLKSTPPPAEQEPRANVLIGYATRPGMPAVGYTDSNRLSTFTQSLVKFVDKPGEEFTSVYMDIADEVRQVTRWEQDPGLVSYSAAYLFLAPTRELIDQQRKVLVSAVTSRQPENVRHFANRFATGPWAAWARHWLEAPGLLATAQEYTLLSPVAVERAWGIKNADVAQPAIGLAFARSIEQSQSLAARELQSAELGVVAPGRKGMSDRTVTGRVAQNIRSAVAHGTMVTTQALGAFAAPSTSAARVATLPAETYITLDEVAGAGSNWVRASAPGVENPFFVQLRSTGKSEVVDLGQPLAEVRVRPLPHGLPELVDSAQVIDALTRVRAMHVLLWVSIATAASDDPEERDRRALRRADVEYLLKRAGVSGRIITAVAAAPGIEGDDVRIRIFGY